MHSAARLAANLQVREMHLQRLDTAVKLSAATGRGYLFAADHPPARSFSE